MYPSFSHFFRLFKGMSVFVSVTRNKKSASDVPTRLEGKTRFEDYGIWGTPSPVGVGKFSKGPPQFAPTSRNIRSKLVILQNRLIPPIGA